MAQDPTKSHFPIDQRAPSTRRVAGVALIPTTPRMAPRLLACVIFAAAGKSWASNDELLGGGELDAAASLASDDQCASGDEDCALNALQLRGQRVRGEAAGDARWGSCLVSKGCGKYKRGAPCQCNEKCTEHGNCCYDYTMVCNTDDSDDEDGPSAPSPAVPVAPLSGKIYGHPSKTKYPSHPGFTLMLVEDFDTPIDLDSDPIWTWSDGGLIEGQIRFTKENIKFEDGKMRIEVTATPAQGTQKCSAAEVAEIKPMPKASGEMRTRYNMFRYGRYEARLKAPSVQTGNTLINGNYVSTMFVFRDGKYKHWREIDFEITGDSTNSITTNVLSADNTDKWSANIADSKQIAVTYNDRADFHDYAIEWLPNSITWYIDGKKVRKYRGNKIPDLSGKIMMNLWLFDDRALFGGPHIKNNRYPMYSEYEWFRFYKWNGEDSYPCADMDSSCLTSDDMYLTKNNPCDGIKQEGTVYGKTACQTTCR
uniref:GH16 domain-containing protein n=1 Tax=Zooxanthella nutricula TaxID=1333877 RepID=A0A7S2IY03_9DINO